VNKFRSIHLYLGCIFAPLIIFFSLSGVWLEFGIQRYPWIHYLSAIHTGSTLKGEAHHPSSLVLQGFVVLMGVSLILTVILGIVLAFKYAGRKMTLACLLAGILIPLAVILVFGR
jgi:hypothetical protein